MDRSILKDKDIREPLFEWIEEGFEKVRILEEIVIGHSRADIVLVLPRELCGIEIKSDADTFTRLENQVKDYNRYFDRNYLVVGSSHARHCSEHIPDWWGIISVELFNGKMDFRIMRESGSNPRKLKKVPLYVIKNKLKFLWRPELAEIQERKFLPKYREKSKDFVRKKLLEKLTAEELDEEISRALFERDYTTIKEKIESFRKERAGKQDH